MGMLYLHLGIVPTDIVGYDRLKCS